MSKKFIEYRPNYFSGFENGEYEVKNFAQVLEIPHVKRFSESPGFYSYAVAVDTKPEYKMMLMALYNWNEEFNGCMNWWVVGHLPGFVMCETNLKQYEHQTASHKPTCWSRKYKSVSDLMGYGRSQESQMKILKELGWHKDDQFGVAQYCDCGYKK